MTSGTSLVGNATTNPYGGSRHGELTGGCSGGTAGCYDASVITTSALSFQTGRYYRVEVYGRNTAAGCNVTNGLKLKKAMVATNAAMVAASGADVILATSTQSSTYTRYSGLFTVSANETKYVGIQMAFAGAGGCGGSGWRLDDIIVTEYLDPPCDFYCAAGNTTAITSYITDVAFNTLSRSSTWDGYICTSIGTSVQRTLSYTLNVTAYNATASVKHLAAWIDYNRDGDYADAGEDVMPPIDITTTTPPQSFPLTWPVTVPITATLGLTKMRVAMVIAGAGNTTACNTADLSDYEDYDVDIQMQPLPMTYSSFTTTQNNLSTVSAGTFNQEIMGIQVVTSGDLSPLSLTSLFFRTNANYGTDNPAADIANARLWTSGTSAFFSTATQVGSTVAAPNGAYSFGTTYTLEPGTNYFWLTYDIQATAPTGDRVDVQCDSIIVASITRTPTLGSPPLGRSIVASWPMYYVSSTTRQNISPVPLGDVNQQVIGVEIVTSGAISPLTVTSFTLNTAGTGGTVPNQIQNAKLFFTGTTAAFSTATQVGSTVASPNGAFTITPSVTLFNGTNYFWFSYDILSTATCALNIDAQCNSLTVSGTPYTPTVTSPLGARAINCGVPYYSVGSLVMNNLSSWNTMRNGSGSPPPAGAFAISSNDFYVQNGHSMTTNAAFTLLNLYVEAGGRVTASNIVTMTNFRIYGGGTFEQTAVATNATYITNFWIDNGGTWIHNNNGYLPGVNRYFTANSTQWFKKVGGGTFPSNTAWGNVIMDISTNGNFYINGNSISTIQGNWEWRKTGTNNWWAIHPTNSPTNIGGDLIISGGKLYGAFNNISAQAANIIINVAGSYKLTGGTFEDYLSPFGNAGSSSCVLNISSNVDISGGTMHFDRTTGGLTQINITGGLLNATWKQRGGTVTLGNTFIKNSPAGKTLTLIGTSMGSIATTRTILLETGATLMTGNYPVNGSGTFTMQDNSTLGIGHIQGIVSNLASAAGNIRTTTARNFHSGGNYIYYEDKTPQVTGVFTTAPTALTVRNLEIRKDSAQYRVDMSQNLSVTEVTKLKLGELNLNSFTLTALNAGTAAIDRNGSTTLGYIKSETNAAVNPSIVQWNIGASNGSYVIPFGVSATDYIPLTFNKTAGNSSMRFSTRATSTSANTPWAGASSVAAVANMNRGTADSSTTSVIDRWWDITALAGISSATANITFTYRGVENTLPDGVTPAGWPNYRTGALAAQHWNGTTWDAATGSGTGVASGTGTVTVTGANTFSPWILIAQPAPLFNTPLPITLLTFDATVVTEGVNLTWTTASEINNKFFTVERSADAEHFEFVASIDGAGNSLQTLNYSLTDRQPLKGISYYRLRQTDFDGTSTLSDIVAVNISEGGTISFVPNPAQNYINIILSDAGAKGINVIEILDAKGNSVLRQEKFMSGENNVQRIDLSNYSSGIYVVKVTDSTGKISVKRFIRR
jgi:hypothetical protein